MKKKLMRFLIVGNFIMVGCAGAPQATPFNAEFKYCQVPNEPEKRLGLTTDKVKELREILIRCEGANK